jgi:hypothetical protein
MTKPTKLEDMSEADQKEILLAWFRDKPLQYWDNWGWIDRENTERPPLRNVAYRIKPEPRSGVVYVHVYPGPMLATAEPAIACVRVDWTEGQFDD